MEKQAIFNLKVDTGNSAKNLSETEKELSKLRNDIKNSAQDTASFEKNLGNLNKVVDKGNLSYKDLNRVIQDYQTIALQAGRESAVGMQAIERAAKLRDEQGKLQASTKALADDNRNLQAAMQLGEGIIAGYTAFQGVTAMMGVENEELLQTITKLQAAQATLNGVQQINKVLLEDSVFMLRAKSAAMAANNTVTKLSTNILRLFGVQVAANNVALGITKVLLQGLGIGLIIGAIALLVNYWEDLTNVISKSAKALANFVGIRDEAFEEEKAQQGERLKMIKGEIDAIDDRATQQEKAIQRHINKLKAEGKDVQDLENQKIRIRIAANEAQKKLFKEEAILIETRRRLNGKLTEEEEKRFEEIKKQYVEILRANKDLTSQLEINEINSNNKRLAEEKKANDLRLKEEEKEKQRQAEAAKLKLERERLIKDLELDLLVDSNEKKLKVLQEQQKREREDLEKKYGKDTEELKLLELKQAKELQELKDQIDKEAFEKETANRVLELENELMQLEDDFFAKLDKELELERYRAERLLENENLSKAEKERIMLELKAKEDKIAEERIEMEKKVQEAKVGMLQMSLGAMANLVDAFSKEDEASQKRAFEINKKIALAQAAINTGMAVTSALANDSVGPGTRFIAAAAAGAAGAAQIAAIARTTFQGGGSEPPTPTAPPDAVSSAEQQNNMRMLQDGGIRQDTSEMNGQQPAQPQQVYVLETDIRSVGNRVDAIETRSVV